MHRVCELQSDSESSLPIQTQDPYSGMRNRLITSSAAPALYKYTGTPLLDVETATETLAGFSVSPNPVANIVRFDFEGATDQDGCRVSLFDVMGQAVFVGEVFERQLDVARFPAGVYFLKVETASGWAMRKIVRD